MSTEPHDPQLEQMDATLLGILQHCGKIEEFLYLVFGFLYRRTDFYVVTKAGERFGLPEGAAERVAASAFKQFQVIAAGKQNVKRREIENQINHADTSKLSEEQNAFAEQYAAAIAAAAEAREREEENNEDADTVPKMKSESESAPTEKDGAPSVSGTSKAASVAASKAASVAASKATSVAGSKATSVAGSKATSVAGSRRESKTPLPNRTQVNDVYNGADYENYSWSQTIREADMRVKVPPHCRSASMLKVVVKKKFISVEMKEDGLMTTLVSGDLIYEINTDESMWTFVPGEYVHFHLEKYPERWWEGVFAEKEKIDLDKIEAVRPMEDLNQESLMCIDGLKEDDDRKKRGLPTREQEKMYEILRKGWNAPGSPFAGQPNPNDALKNRSRGPLPDFDPDLYR